MNAQHAFVILLHTIICVSNYDKLFPTQTTPQFPGFSETMKILQKLHLIDPQNHAALHPNGPDITWVST